MTVAEGRNYALKTVKQAKEIAFSLLKEYELDRSIHFGLPEIDDRYHVWRVPLINGNVKNIIGELLRTNIMIYILLLETRLKKLMIDYQIFKKLRTITT